MSNNLERLGEDLRIVDIEWIENVDIDNNYSYNLYEEYSDLEEEEQMTYKLLLEEKKNNRKFNEEENFWIDPAGGTHSDYDDPALSYI